MKTWDPSIDLDRSSHVPLPLQLAHALARDIRAGRLRPGQVLPSSRQLARVLGVHRNTVVAAMDELKAQGWVESARASHLAVAAELPASSAPAGGRHADAIGFSLPARRLASRGFEAAPRGVLDFTGGLPDPRLLPASVLARAYRRALKKGGSAVLGFSDPAGHPRLRAAIAAMLRTRRGLDVAERDVLITRGSQLAHHLIGLALFERGDVVAVESPGYPSTREGFALVGARLAPVPVDRHGLDVEALARLLDRRRVRAVSVTPLVQDPTTATLSAARRLQLLDLARRHRMAVLEADYDYEFQFDGAAVQPLAASDHAGVVVYVGTLTKALGAGLRLGFVVAPSRLRDRMLEARAVVDRQGDAALELAVAELLEDGELLRHAWRARREFQRRRDVLVAALRRRLHDVVELDVPRGGLALWVRAPGVDVDAWAARALAGGVRFFTGRHYQPSGRPLRALRLGFAHLDAAELERAVEVLARTVLG
ncbi:MAG: PLP-dependent aminotransferase family protein [Deltaproteobacteria bacterium]|nr:PLP-dependent aminotransferase family protein [Deltaproteobacteria bacterium]